MPESAQRFVISPGIPNPAIIAAAVKCLRRGGLVIFPTETVYGVAANADDPAAVERIYQIKGRADAKPFTLHVGTVEQARRLPVRWSPVAEGLAKRYWPGPLTLVVARLQGGTLGIRVPKHPVAEAFLTEAGVPVIATSANVSGEPAPTTAEEADRALGSQVDCILNAGPTTAGDASTVVDCTVTPPKVLRAGALGDQIERAIETILRVPTRFGPGPRTAAAPRPRAAHAPAPELSPGQVRKILCVCTGNSCRSVMAEGLLRHLLRQAGHPEFQVVSAGLGTSGGFGPTTETLMVMKAEGVDVAGHVSRPVTSALVLGSDLILTMEEYHRQTILERHPEAAPKVFLLKEFMAAGSSDDPDIADPIGRPMEVYEQCLLMVKESIERVVAWLTSGR